MNVHKHYSNKDFLKLRVANMVVTFNLGCFIDLETLAINCKHIIASPNEFAAGVGRFVNPKCVFFVFSTGSVIIAGLTNEPACQLAAVTLCDIIRVKGKIKHVSINNFEIINITLSVPVDGSINILQIKKDYPHAILKNVGRFPNIVWPSTTSSLSLCIFASGKINSVGGTSFEMGKQGFIAAFPALEPYIYDNT
jgi:TATA-box binding protein (TBP) (component of TFIID and TFIIIB)